MKDKINNKVKHREAFRPFAPAILKEFLVEYFGGSAEDKYMLKIAKIREDKKNKFPAATHVDVSSRVQTVTKEDNEHFYNLLKDFHKKTGLPLLLNTSFNERGKPIVETPGDAIATFLNTGIDILVLRNYIITKRRQ